MSMTSRAARVRAGARLEADRRRLSLGGEGRCQDCRKLVPRSAMLTTQAGAALCGWCYRARPFGFQ